MCTIIMKKLLTLVFLSTFLILTALDSSAGDKEEFQELPIFLDFELFDGINLSEAYPGWHQAKGQPPSPDFSNSSWFKADALYGSVTAGVILSYVGLKDEWIISPEFDVTEHTKLSFMAALTRFWDDPVQGHFAHNDSLTVMAALEGFNFTEAVYTFDMSNQPPWESAYYDVDLSDYAGESIRLGFYITNGQEENSLLAFHLNDIMIKNDPPRDALAFDLANPSPVSCFTDGMPVVATIKNDGLEPISSVPVKVRVRGAHTDNLFGAYEGTIAPGDYVDVEVGIIDNPPYGAYEFEIQTELPGDGFADNDVVSSIHRYHQDARELPLPQMNFIGFYTDNLGDLYPGWYEARGIDWPRVAMNTDWQGSNYDGARTANVYFSGLGTEDWLVGPQFNATENLVVEMRAAVEYDQGTNQMGSDDELAIMVSPDCGETWERVDAFTQQSGVTPSLQEFTFHINGYAGEEIILAFYATTGSTNDPESYLFHITDVKIKNLYAQDAGVTHLLAPSSGCGFSDEEEVTVRIENFGSSTISDFEVAYQINGGAPIVETVSESLEYGETMDYTFTQTADLTGEMEYAFSVFTLLENDENPDNDGLDDVMIRITAFDLATEGAYFMGFDEGEDYDDWTVEDANNDGITWQREHDPQHANSGEYSYAYFSNQTSVPSDDWLFSPCFNLEEGLTYYVSFYYKNRATVWPESLRLAIGQEPTGSAMDQELIDLGEIDNPPYQKAEVTFTVDESGSYYFGWHAYGPADQFGMHVDDITIYQVFDYDLAVTDHVRPRAKGEDCQLQDAGFIEVEVTNFGTEDVSSFDMGISVDGDSYIIPVDEAIESGEARWITLENSFTIPSDEIVDLAVWTDHAQDLNTANDTLYIPEYLMTQYMTSFDDSEDFSNWHTVSLEGVHEWHHLENPSVSRTGDFVYAIRTDLSSENTGSDDWLFTECFYLQAGTCYDISFFYRSHFSTENLRLYIGDAQDPDAMAELLIDLPSFDTDNLYEQASRQFTVDESGVYYFGWHTDGGTSGRYFIYIDDVAIVEDLESQPIAAPDYMVLDHEVAFYAHADNASTFHWDFGDGHTSDEENPFHLYDEAGVYEVSLTVGSGCVDQTYSFDLSLEIPVFQVTFDIRNQHDETVDGATVILDGDEQAPGDYLFELIQGGYLYAVGKEDHEGVDGAFTVIDEDLVLTIELVFEGEEDDDTYAQEIVASELIDVYPNPASEYIQVHFEGKVKRLEVINLSGQRVYHTTGAEFTGASGRIDISGLQLGTYLLRIYSEEKAHHAIFIKTQ